MKKIIFSLFVLATLACQSCQSLYYQVYETTCEPSVKHTKDYLVWENADCKISYNFWDNKGIMKFLFENKTDSTIIIDMAQTYAILNGVGTPYYKGKIWSDNGSYVIEQQKKYVAPHTSILFNTYLINDDLITDCDLKEKPRKKDHATLQYDKETSPLTFANYVTYQVGRQAQQHVRNEFFVHQITNLPSGKMLQVKTEYICGKKTKSWDYTYPLNNRQGSFYLRYMK